MSQILIEGIKLYAHHGCTKEEQDLGGKYEVDVRIKADLSKAALTDDLKDTIDYVSVYNIVKEQMEIRSKLIEHVTQRIVNQLKMTFPEIEEVEVELRKISVPIGGSVDYVAVIINA